MRLTGKPPIVRTRSRARAARARKRATSFFSQASTWPRSRAADQATRGSIESFMRHLRCATASQQLRAAASGRHRAHAQLLEQCGELAVAMPREALAQDRFAGAQQPALGDLERGARRSRRFVRSATAMRDRSPSSSCTHAFVRASALVEHRRPPMIGHSRFRAMARARAPASVLRSAIVRFASLPVAFADDMDVGDLEDAGLDRLDVVAEPGRRHDDGRVRSARDLDLVLADADGLDDDDVEARGVEDVDRVERAARQAAERAARRHAADEHAGIAAELAHADAVAEDRAAGERARRIDRDDARSCGRSRRIAAASFATSVDLPLPGTPVMPTTCARPACAEHRVERRARLRRSPDSGARQKPRDRARVAARARRGSRSQRRDRSAMRRVARVEPRVHARGTPRDRR